MNDPLEERTRQLLTDYILFSTREPGNPEPPPTSVEAALLRSVTRQTQQEHWGFFSTFYDCHSNRLELVTRMAENLLPNDQGFNWGSLVMLLAFVGTILNQGPCRNVKQRRDLRNHLLMDRDCYLIVCLLYRLLMGRHRSWLEAHDGWDGFCRFFKKPLPLGFWRRWLIQGFLSCFFAMAIFYIWKHF